MMIETDELTEQPGGDARAVPVQPFAWKHFATIVIGVILIIAVICTIATLVGKPPARFS